MTVKIDRLDMRLLSVDKAALMEIAKAEGETMSVLIRRLIRQEIQKQEGVLNDSKCTNQT